MKIIEIMAGGMLMYRSPYNRLAHRENIKEMVE